MVLYQRDLLSVRLLRQEDAPLLVKWLSDPKVLSFYEGRDRPHDMEMVRESFYSGDEDETKCIVQYEGHPIGYIQFYSIGDEERDEYGLNDFPESVYGMDQFIGETGYWGRGIGTLLVRATVDYLIKERAAGKIVMDPQTANVRALHVYEKCGFRKTKLLPKREMHEGEMRDCWLIEYDAGR